MIYNMSAAEQALAELFSRQFALQFGIPRMTGDDAGAVFARQVHVVMRGDQAEFQVSLSYSDEHDQENTFLQIVQLCHQALPHLRLAEEAPKKTGLKEFYTCFLQSDTWGTSLLSCAGAGVFSNQELQDMHWYILNRQVMQARMVLFRKLDGAIDTCLQPGSSGELYRIESEKGDTGGRLLFRNHGLYRREPSDTCYFAGTLEFPLTSLSTFLAGLPIAIDLPASLTVLDSCGKSLLVRMASEKTLSFLLQDCLLGDFQAADVPGDAIITA